MIVVCGEALIDLLPAEDGTERPTPGGGPFTTARALARLEIPTQFLGRISMDTYGQMLADLLVADGVDLSLASFGPEPSTMAIASLDARGLAAYNASDAELIAGKRTVEIEAILGYRGRDEMIHRDDLILTGNGT